MTRTIVGVLRGGTSGEYDLSLKTGSAMLEALPQDRYETRDILIDRTGMWHQRGQPATPARALSQVDVVLNAIHGGVGEDGSVQRMLERAGVAYAGSRALPSGIALNKIRAREILQRAGVLMPRATAFSIDNDLNTAEMSYSVFEQFGPPYLIKPPSEGAGRGIRLATTLVALPDALGDVIDEYGAAIVQEYIRGREASVGVIDGFRGQELYALPPAHADHDLPFIHPEAHESGSIRYVSPSPFTHDEKQKLMNIARAAHQALNLSHFSRADIMVAPHGIYLLEMNTVPGLYPGASFPVMLDAVGSSVAEFLEHAIGLAIRSR